jgi:signal transduction histidine kinase
MDRPGIYSPGLSRADASHLRTMHILRVYVLGTGVVIGLVVELAEHADRLDPRFALGASLFLFCTFITFSAGFQRFARQAIVAVALLDMVTLLLLFDVPVGRTLVEALIAGPAMWLAVALGRRGVLLAAVACTVVFVVPGLLIAGTPDGGWHHASIIVAFAVVGSAAIATSAEMWDFQLLLLEKRTAELKRAVDVKDEFIALVSHELRTPLTSIIGYLDLAMEESEEIPGAINSHLEAVSRNADRLLVLVTDLLAAELAEREPMHLVRESINVSSLVQLSIDDIRLRAETAGVEIISDVEPGISIFADSNRMLQVVDNLLSNAVKYTPPTGTVTLVLRRRPGHVVLEVSDTGIGIGPEDQDGLFTKFFRARNATDLAIPGIGLGLMITRRIVDAHGGTIVVHSQEGVGTSMQVVLPVEGITPPHVDGHPARALPESARRAVS